MDFTIDQRLAGPPDAVTDVLLDPSFIDARADLPKLGGAELLDTWRDEDRARLRVRHRFTGDLASAVTAVIDRDRLTWVDDATYDLATNTAEHTIHPDNYADRLSCSYTATVTADTGGSLRQLRGTLKVKMLLVGGKVEGAIFSGMRDYAVAEATLLDRWLTRER